MSKAMMGTAGIIKLPMGRKRARLVRMQSGIVSLPTSMSTSAPIPAVAPTGAP
jgi:hypothetical protein